MAASGGDFETLRSWRETAPELTPDVYIHLCRQLGGGRMVEACKECAETAGVKLEKAARYCREQDGRAAVGGLSAAWRASWAMT